jgi:hypothetical protein
LSTSIPPFKPHWDAERAFASGAGVFAPCFAARFFASPQHQLTKSRLQDRPAAPRPR